MKKFIIGLVTLTSLSAFANDIGKCSIHAISDTSSDDNTPHRVFNVEIGETSLTKCLKEFERDIKYLKSCGMVVGGKIHYIELQFTISNRTVSTVEALNVNCL